MYNRSLKYKWDNQNVRDYAEETGMKRGLERGLEQGLEQGRMKAIKEKNEIALKLKLKGMPVEEIKEITGLSVEEIEVLSALQ